MNVKEIAADIARELRAHPERWTQGHWARAADGDKVHWNSPRAVCWCLEGHINRRDGDTGEFAEAAGTMGTGGTTGLATFNDRYAVGDVIDLCERVAA